MASNYIHLTEEVNSKTVSARWGSASGTAYGVISTANTWQDGFDNGAASVTVGGAVTLTGSHVGDNWNVSVPLTSTSSSVVSPQSTLINLADAKTYYRQGYTQGTFTGPIPITPIGNASVTVGLPMNWYKGNGSKYKAVTAYTLGSTYGSVVAYGTGGRYKSTNLYPSAGEVTTVGTAHTVTKQTGIRVGSGPYSFTSMTVYNSSGRSLGTRWVGMYGNSELWAPGSEFTYYDIGANVATVYEAGAKVNKTGVAQSCLVSDNSGSYYLRGTQITGAIAPNASGSYHLVGDQITGALAPDDENGTYVLRGDPVTARENGVGITYYAAGTAGNYYTKDS